MGLLKPAVNQTAYLKAGVLGFQGSGKTFTSGILARGLCQKMGNNRAAFFDTETGSDFLIDDFKADGIELFTHKARAFTDLCQVIQECEKEKFGVLIIDSITHVWGDLMESYKKKKRLNRLAIHHIMNIKQEWQRFSDLYVNSKLSIIMCGRAGYEWGHDEDDEGKKQLVKKGIKMKAESEIGFEPSLLIEMERIYDDKHKLFHHCHILKDRTNRLNGKTIINPKFKDFKPVIDFLNVGGEHVGVDTERTSEDMFSSPDTSISEFRKQQEIVFGEIKETLTLGGLDGTKQEVKSARTKALMECFGTSVQEKMAGLSIMELEEGLKKLRVKLAVSIPTGNLNEPTFDADEKIQ